MNAMITKQNPEASLKMLLEMFLYFDGTESDRIVLSKRLEEMATYIKNGGKMPETRTILSLYK